MKEIKTVTINGIERTAVNKLARVATMPAKETDVYKIELPSCVKVYDAPLKTKAVPRYLEDLIGTKRGKMTVVGYLGYQATPSYNRNKRHPPHKWLVKCICGKYEVRDGYKWRRGLKSNTPDEGCAYCHYFTRKIAKGNNNSLN